MTVITNIAEITKAAVELANKYPSLSLNGLFYTVPVSKTAITKQMEIDGLEFVERAEGDTSPQRLMARLYPDFEALRTLLDDLQAVREMEVIREPKKSNVEAADVGSADQPAEAEEVATEYVEALEISIEEDEDEDETETEIFDPTAL